MIFKAGLNSNGSFLFDYVIFANLSLIIGIEYEVAVKENPNMIMNVIVPDKSFQIKTNIKFTFPDPIWPEKARAIRIKVIGMKPKKNVLGLLLKFIIFLLRIAPNYLPKP